MFWINGIIFIILCCFIVYKIFKHYHESIQFLSCLVTAMVAFIIFGYSSMFVPTEYEYQFSQEIIAIQDSQTYLISRYNVNSTIKYYYIINYNGGYISQNVPQNNSIIFETNNKPEVKYYKERYKHKISRLIFGEYKEIIGADKYEFYIPTSSIKQEFNIDLR